MNYEITPVKHSDNLQFKVDTIVKYGGKETAIILSVAILIIVIGQSFKTLITTCTHLIEISIRNNKDLN